MPQPRVGEECEQVEQPQPETEESLSVGPPQELEQFSQLTPAAGEGDDPCFHTSGSVDMLTLETEIQDHIDQVTDLE